MSVKRWNNWCCTTHGHTMSESPVGLYILASDYDALAARLAEAERDAARYRWLRDTRNESMDFYGTETEFDQWVDEWQPVIEGRKADEGGGEGGK